MAGEISTIQSLKAVDAWIDVINANINGGVRTAFKSSRLKFSGSNVDISRAGSSTSLPLQFPEPGLTTANTIIDFSQGAITASTENTHLAIQGEGFFMLCDPASMTATGTITNATAATRLYATRDGEFRTNQSGLLVNSSGYFLVTGAARVTPLAPEGAFDTINMRAVYNDIDNPALAPALTGAVKLTDFLRQDVVTGTTASGGAYGYPGGRAAPTSILKMTLGKQQMRYTQFGSTIFDFGYVDFDIFSGTTSSFGVLVQPSTTSDATILSKSLEASNASMTQSVPELSLAQKLFSALTKVLQTKQTNIDGVLNLVR
jgi:flagellar hook protein FlgE